MLPRKDTWHRPIAHVLGIAGMCLCSYGLLQMRSVSGLVACAIGGALVGIALGRLR
jgi:hypothetical protein